MELWALPVRESKSADVHPGVVFVSEIPSPLASLPLLVLSAIAMVLVHHQNASGGDNELAWAHACARGVARGSHGRDTHPRASRPRSIGVSWTITRKAKSRVPAREKDSIPRARRAPAPACLVTAGARRPRRVRRESIGGDRRDERRADVPGAPPTMDLDGARSAVEQASTGLAHPAHRAASEATLLEFRRSPHALPRAATSCRRLP